MSVVPLNLTGLPGLPLGELYEGSVEGTTIVAPVPENGTTSDFHDDEDLSECIAAVDEKTFFFQARYFLVTYATWIDKQAIIKWFSEIHKAKYVRVAHEIGTKKIDYQHTHVYVDFGKYIQRTNPRCFDYGSIHPNIGPIRFQKHLNRIFKYMCKYDHENDDMLALIKREWTVEDVWQCKTVQEALRNTPKATEVAAVIQAFSLKPRLEEYQPKDWIFPWQQKWHDRIINEPGDYRSINWIHERIGGTGKSYFAREMFMRYPREVYTLKQMGGAEKCATIIANALNEGWSGRCLIVDLPRNAEDKSIYEPLESIRDGMVTATRYSGKTFVFDIKWVIVLANFPPQTFSMSMDRWKIHDHNGMNLENKVPEPIIPEEKSKTKAEAVHACLSLIEQTERLIDLTGNLELRRGEEYIGARNYLLDIGWYDQEESEESDENVFEELDEQEAIHKLANMQPKKSHH